MIQEKLIEPKPTVVVVPQKSKIDRYSKQTELIGLVRCKSCGYLASIDELKKITVKQEQSMDLIIEHADGSIEKKFYAYKCNSIDDLLYRVCHKCGGIGYELEVKSMPEVEVDIFVTGEEIKELEKAGDVIAQIIDKGKYNEFQNDKNETIRRLQLGIKLPNGEERKWSANNTSLRRLVAAWGKNSDSWEGKKVKLYQTLQNVRGNEKFVVYGQPAEEKPAEPAKEEKKKE